MKRKANEKQQRKAIERQKKNAFPMKRTTEAQNNN
jgi:hypothetical protein